MSRLGALVLIAAALSGCGRTGALTEQEALDVTCVHAAGGFGVAPFAGGGATHLRDVARVLEIDARLLRDAGAEDAAKTVSTTVAALQRELAGGKDVTLYLKDDTTEAGRAHLEELAAELPGVESVEYVSAEQAYEEYLEHGEETPGVSPETLPDSIEIYAAEGVDRDEIAEALEGEPAVDEVRISGDLEPMATLQGLGDLCELPF